MPEHKQVSQNYSTKELWTRGKIYEIFGLMSGEFTALELAKEYSRLLNEVRDPEEEQILEDAFAVLNAPFTRQFYEGCRMIMGQIEREIGETEYEEFEDKIWADVWGWVSQKWQPLPEELVRALIIKYGGAVKVAASSSRTFAPAPAQPRRIELERKRRKNWIIVGSVLGSIAAILLMVKACPSSPPPVLNVNTSPIYFDNLTPGLLEADSWGLTIVNTGGGKLTGTLTADKNWLAVSPSEIEVGNGANQNILILVDTIGLKYKVSDNCFLTIKTNGGEKQIPVYLSITSVIFEDDFSNPNSGWPVGPTKYGNAKYENGGYRITANDEEYITVSTNQYIGVLDDFIFEVDATPTPQTSGYTQICVLFRNLDSDNYYQFLIIRNIDTVINYTPFSLTPKPGVYTFGKNVAGQFTTLQDWTESSAINKAVPVVNRLKIVCQGANISLYCNGTLLQTFTDYSLKEGEIKLGTGVEKKYSTSSSASVGDVLFDNLKISAP